MALQKILSWNKNGLNSPQKHRKIFHYVEKQKCDIIYLQETIIRLRDQHLLSCTKLGKLYSISKETKPGWDDACVAITCCRTLSLAIMANESRHWGPHCSPTNVLNGCSVGQSGGSRRAPSGMCRDPFRGSQFCHLIRFPDAGLDS